MRNHIYKIKHKFKKKPELLEKYGFIPYKSDDDEEIIYAQKVVLNEETYIFKYLKRAMEKIYTYATSEERQKDFSAYTFNEILTEKQQRDYDLVITDQIRKEFSECQICFANSGLGAWSLFINAPDMVEYYNTEVVKESAPDLIEFLLKEKVIYKTLAPKQK